MLNIPHSKKNGMCGVSVSWKGGMKMKLIGRKILSFVKLGVKWSHYLIEQVKQKILYFFFSLMGRGPALSGPVVGPNGLIMFLEMFLSKIVKNYVALVRPPGC